MATVLTMVSNTGSVAQLITVILIFILVLVITVYTTKFIGGYQKAQGKNRNLEVIETIRVSNTKYIQIVRAANKYIVIGIGKNEISMLTEVDEDELINLGADKDSVKENFASVILKAKEKLRKDNNEQNNE